MNRTLRRQHQAAQRRRLKAIRRAIKLLGDAQMGRMLVAAGWTPPSIPAEGIAEAVAETPDVSDAAMVRAQFAED